MNVELADLDFDLPESQIARFPMEPRDHCRLLVVEMNAKVESDQHFYDLPRFLRKGDVLVLNETKVLPARLFPTDEKGKKVEILLLEELPGDPLVWSCLTKGVGKSETLFFAEGVSAFLNQNGKTARLQFYNLSPTAFFSWIESHGTSPLPPYIKRVAEISDKENYQTVFAREPGSVAAPTAGLHFTPQLLDSIKEQGVQIAYVTLHVGYGTFAPIRTSTIEAHSMHEERYDIPAKTFQLLKEAKEEGRRIIAVGTTSLRALESIPTTGLCGRTRLFIRPGFRFQWANGLITNFHTPRSTLLVLVSAMLGKKRTLELYEEAIRKGYRFYSYGDAMAVLPS